MGGTVLRGNDGSLYFIRDELLEQCKVTGEHLDHLNGLLEKSSGEVEGFLFLAEATGGVVEGSLAYVQGDALTRPEPNAPAAMSVQTLMCPW
jgi:hypothetical protein